MFELSRRALLGGAAATYTTILYGKALGSRSQASWPTNFLWGAGTAAHQVEGNNTNSDMWLIESLPESGFAERSGIACDHFRRYKHDIRLLSRLGFNTFRFSIEWARVEPSPGQFSIDALQHYRSVLEACKAQGLQTVVTLFHFTAPLWLAKRGGFTNPEVPDFFARYAAKVAEHCGDLIDWISTVA